MSDQRVSSKHCRIYCEVVSGHLGGMEVGRGIGLCFRRACAKGGLCYVCSSPAVVVGNVNHLVCYVLKVCVPP